MIQIEAIHIQEFRGIRDLTLTLSGKSFVVWGPNGSGKSGVVDAIGFALTGDIARLRGAGSGGLTVLKHGPHVHRRDDPGVAKVSLTVREAASGKSAVLARSVKTANTYTLSPDIAEVRAAIDWAQQHPELTLSRREVIKYIITEPGARAQEVQALLKLDRLEGIRGVLRTAQSKTTTAEKAAQTAVDVAEQAVRCHLDLPSLLTAEVTSEINKRRAVLGLDAVDTVRPDTDLAKDVDRDPADGAFNKVSAIRDVQSLTAWLADGAELTAAVGELSRELDDLDADPDILASMQLRGFVDTGLSLVTSASCPLCDTDWRDVDSLRVHLADKIVRFDAAAELQRRIHSASEAVVAELCRGREFIRTTRPHASFGAAELQHRLQSWSEDLVVLETHLGTVEGAASQRDRLTNDPLALPPDATADLAGLLTILEAKPDQTAIAGARTFLTIAQERWTALRLARAEHAKTVAAHATASAVYRAYCEASDGALASLYQTVQEDFSTYYREINADDESAFKAKLGPSAGKLDLNVDFHGLGMFPPGAYHSEGHQDGMGVCLYLALVQQLLGDNFRFAVLDDVVMSVDSNHRRQFCKLLKDRFPNVQFIITTHDEIWARQMHSSGLLTKAAQVHFHGWTVDDGPAHEVGSDFWDKIDADLVRNDVPAAAARLRRNLESIMTDLAAKIRGQVAYRPEANYDLGELLAAVKGRHGTWLKKAASSANSWNNAAEKGRVESLKQARLQAVLAQEGENWAVNSAVHFNEWAALSKGDFRPVVDAWKGFLGLFSCANPSCELWIYVVGQPGHEEELRCRCGAYSLNLLTK